MKLTRCPLCRTHLHLDALVQDEAGREVLSILAKLDKRIGPALVGYVALFRPEKSDLSNSRAARLMAETLELNNNHACLTHALTETKRAIHAKRQQAIAFGQQAKPLSNHNYLKQVLTSIKGEFTAHSTPVKNGSTVEIRQFGQLSPEKNEQLRKEQLARMGIHDAK